MNKSSLLNLLVFGLIAIALTACGLKKKGDMLVSGGFSCSTNGANAARAQFYAQTVYPYTAGCVTCHGTGTNPQFQVSNPATGWDNLVLYFGEDNPLPDVRTKLAPPLSHNLSYLPASGLSGFDAKLDDFDSLMDQYDAFCASQNSGGNNNGGGGGNNNGGGGSNNPTVEANRRFSTDINLGTLTGTLASRTFLMATGTAAPFSSVQMQADFRVYDAGGNSMVIMKNLRVVSSASAIKISNVRFKVNGAWKWDDYPNFSGINTTVNQGTTLVSVSADSQILSALRANNATDTLTISAQMDVTSPVQTELQQFVADVRPILMNQCVSCHSGVAGFQFNNATSDTALRTLVVNRVNKTTPTASLILTKAQLPVANGGVAHNGSNTATKPLQNDTGSVNKIIAWIGRL